MSTVARDRDFCDLREVENKAEVWERNKRQAELVTQLYYKATTFREKPYNTTIRDELDAKRYATLGERCNDCSNWLEFGMVTNDNGEVKPKLKRASFCHVRHCPMCQWRRQIVWKSRFNAALPRLMSEHKNTRWLFLTLTQKNCSPEVLRKTIQGMNKAFVRLTQRKAWPGFAWARSLEVTKGKHRMAHPHIHSLIAVPPGYFSGGKYLSQEEWTTKWKQAARLEYTPVVNIKAVKGETDEAMRKAIAETFKYTVKPDDFVKDEDWLYQMTDQLHNTRAISIGGDLRHIMREEEPETDEDLIGLETEDIGGNDGGWHFHWYKERKKYQCAISKAS